MRDCNKHLVEALALVRSLIILADEGERDAQDDSCILLYGIIRDSAYRIRHLAEKERDAHVVQGKWDGPAPSGSEQSR